MTTYSYLLFYADTPRGEKNKLFRWSIVSIIYWRQRLEYWIRKGYVIRAAYVEERIIDTGTGTLIEKTNARIEDSEILSIVDSVIASK